MQSDIDDLIRRVQRRLTEIERRCEIEGPRSDDAIAAAEDQLGTTFPPSYRSFLLRHGALGIPADLAVVHDFCGLASGNPKIDVVQTTMEARAANQLADHLIVVGKGANDAEWFCLDVGRAHDDGECPVLLFDPAANQVDQVFYDSFGAMVREVLEFVEDTLRGDGAPRD